jgi:hypothetical protein
VDVVKRTGDYAKILARSLENRGCLGCRRLLSTEHGGSVPRFFDENEKESALARFRFQCPKIKNPRNGGWEDGIERRSIVVRCGNDIEREVCFGRGDLKVVPSTGNGSKNFFPRVEELSEVVTAELVVRPPPSVVKGIDIGIAADAIGEEFLATIGPTLAAFGHEIDALILDQDDAALVGDCLGQYGPQVGTSESDRHG